MGNCLILKPGALTTLQDNGRIGYAHYAVPRSGVMNPYAAQKAQQLVGNNLDWPILECTLKGPTLKFESATSIALTGGDMRWKLNGESIERDTTIKVQVNDLLSSGFTKDQPRSYLAIMGQIETTYHYNSCSTYRPAKLGHNHGQPLAKGDLINWKAANTQGVPKPQVVAETTTNNISIHKGPEYNLLSEKSMHLLISEPYKIGPDSNRMGARLIGPELNSASIKNSVPVLPGFIQLTPSGQPIIILQDGQTTGGYPRIAYIKPKDLSALNRIPIGQPFRFHLVS